MKVLCLVLSNKTGKRGTRALESILPRPSCGPTMEAIGQTCETEHKNDAAYACVKSLYSGNPSECRSYFICSKRGLFWRLKTISNDLDPDFDRSSIRLSRFFCRNLGDLQKKKFSARLQPSFLVQITSGP